MSKMKWICFGCLTLTSEWWCGYCRGCWKKNGVNIDEKLAIKARESGDCYVTEKEKNEIDQAIEDMLLIDWLITKGWKRV